METPPRTPERLGGSGAWHSPEPYPGEWAPQPPAAETPEALLAGGAGVDAAALGLGFALDAAARGLGIALDSVSPLGGPPSQDPAPGEAPQAGSPFWNPVALEAARRRGVAQIYADSPPFSDDDWDGPAEALEYGSPFARAQLEARRRRTYAAPPPPDAAVRDARARPPLPQPTQALTANGPRGD